MIVNVRFSFRRATCYLQTLQYKKAIADFKKVLSLEPHNGLVKQQLDSTQKLLRRVEFEKVAFPLFPHVNNACSDVST